MREVSYENLLSSAFRYVSYRPRSEKEIRDFLAKKSGSSSEENKIFITRIIDILRTYGYADDNKFVSWWVIQRNTFRPKGIRVLREELKQKGIPEEIIRNTLKTDVTQEYRLGLQVATRNLSKIKHLPSLLQKKRLISALSRRGFAFDAISRIVDEVTGKRYNTDE